MEQLFDEYKLIFFLFFVCLCVLQGNLRYFIDYVKIGNLEKVNKMINKGLDFNFYDFGIGGMDLK